MIADLRKVFLLALFLVLLFCWPILLNLESSGRGDWDQFFFYSEVPQITVFQYHQFPFWNPYYMGGSPLMAHPQTRFFSPSFLFSSLFGVVSGMKIEVVSSVLLGFLGMFLLSRYLNMMFWAAVLAASIFVFNGSLVVHITAGHFNFLPVVYVPFVFLYFLKSESEPKFIPLAASWLALMLYQGGTYPAAFFLLSLFIYTCFRTVTWKNHGLWLSFLGMGFMAFLFTAPKLLLSISFLAEYPRWTTAGGSISLGCLRDVFWSQYNLYFIPWISSSCFKDFGYTGWWELGAYLGSAVVALFVSGGVLVKQQRAFFLTAVFLLVIGVGNFSSWAPWTLLHGMPLFNNMQIPMRILIVFVFYVSLMAGFCLDAMAKVIKQALLQRLLITVVLAAVLGDLFTTNVPLWHQSFGPYKIPISQQLTVWGGHVNESPFVQVAATEVDKFAYGAWSGMHRMLLQNKGTINGYEPIPVKTYAFAQGHPAYKGEYFLLNNNGTAEQAFWSPNKLIFDVRVRMDDRLVVNQNFEKSWHSSVGKVESYQGLISVKIGPDVKQVVLWYFPYSFIWGMLLFLLGVVVSIKFFIRPFRNSRGSDELG